MGGFLMVRIMVGFVRDRLGRGEAPDHKNAYNKETDKEPSGHALHRNSHCNRTGERMVLECRRKSQGTGSVGTRCLPGRIRKKFAVYCADYFVR